VVTVQGDRWSLHCSLIKECDRFVIFDERCCHGADMKLNSDAIALLTICSKMCKVKLRQAAGRLRDLDKYISKIAFFNYLGADEAITSLHVLQSVF
jgi:hypothetical protein